jgi:hypothetical protein
MNENKGVFTRILAIVGTVLVGLPILAPILLGIVSLFQDGRFRLDYLMPAELFPLVLVGGVLLLWAALRRRRFRGLIGWGLGGAVLLLVGSQALAEVTGLASGATHPGGWQWALVLGVFFGFILAVILTGVGGVLLMREVFKKG